MILKNLAKAIRVATVAPIMAFVMLLTLFLCRPAIYGGPVHFALAVLFLVVFPLLAYPLQPAIKKFRQRGREGQRTLAIYFAVAGYIGGLLSALALSAPKSVWIIYLTYFVSGVLIMLCSKAFHFKASGHACGVAGPFAILICFGQAAGYVGIPVLALVCWSSLLMKRHTALQLLAGTCISVVSLALILLAFRIA